MLALKGPKMGSTMNAIVIEHVKVEEPPEAWRAKLATRLDARVTVRIEETAPPQAANEAKPQPLADDPAFGFWRDREDMADVEAYLRKIRAPRYRPDGTRNAD
jgi:hypothetical protein